MTQNRYVDGDECAEMRRLADDGAEQQRIAAVFDRAVGTVDRHVGRDCRHGDDINSEGDVVDAVHELAETLDPSRIPSQTEWNNWDDRPCSAKRLKTVCDTRSWSDVIEACGYPELPRNTSLTFRVHLFDRPEIMEVTR